MHWQKSIPFVTWCLAFAINLYMDQIVSHCSHQLATTPPPPPQVELRVESRGKLAEQAEQVFR